MKETGYLLQAALITLWGVGLASSERFFEVFQFDGVSELVRQYPCNKP